jgi:hypothetical protein
MGKWKIRLIEEVLKLGVHVVISDIDTAWLQDPAPFFDRFPEVGAGGLCPAPQPGVCAPSWWRPTAVLWVCAPAAQFPFAVLGWAVIDIHCG